MTETTSALRERLKAGGGLLAPGIFDGVSALAATRMGADALYLTGYGVSASLLAQPDAGFLTCEHMVDRLKTIRAVTDLPLIADADTGFGDVTGTVRDYAKAGASAIQIEDQVWPKRCGHTQGRKVVPLDEARNRIAEAVEAAKESDLVIIARTDARTQHGLDEAIKRAEAFRDAGADILFVESPESAEEMKKIAEHFEGALLLANMVPGGRTPSLSREALTAMGYALIIHPVTPLAAAARALEDSYRELGLKGGPTGAVPTLPFAELNKLVGFERIWAMDEDKSEG